MKSALKYHPVEKSLGKSSFGHLHGDLGWVKPQFYHIGMSVLVCPFFPGTFCAFLELKQY